MPVDPIRRVPVPVDTQAPNGRTNGYLVGDVLVDPAGRTDELDTAVAEREIEHVAVTHTHPDHVGAVSEYAAETGATVWARYGHADRFERATGVTPDRTFRDGDRVGQTRVVETPGHTRDHVAFAVDDANGEQHLVCGDLAVAEGSVVVGFPEGDVRSYLTSLRRLRAGNYGTLRPGHGPAIENPDATLERLIAHRLNREDRVLEAVRGGATDVDAVLEAAYDKDLTGVEALARATVEAHLAKLARTGRISRDWLAWLD